MDLADALANVADQDRGRWLDVIDPWEGQPTGMRFRVAGPDSDVQRRAKVAMMDELAEMAGPDGNVSFENREAARLGCLARCVLAWEIEENGTPVPLSHKAIIRVLRSVLWVQEQVDAFAGDRAAFRSEGD